MKLISIIYTDQTNDFLIHLHVERVQKQSNMFIRFKQMSPIVEN